MSEVKAKKWHQKWWGIVILIIFTLFIIIVLAIVYEFFIYIDLEVKRIAQRNELYQNIQQNLKQSTNPISSYTAAIETADDPRFGPADAKVKVVEFADFQCPYCLDVYPTVSLLMTEYGDRVLFIYRDMPNLSSHENALAAAQAAECADEQGGFWSYHDSLFDNQDDLSVNMLKQLAIGVGLDTDKFNQCLDSNKYQYEVLNDLEDAAKLNLQGTPTFFINGQALGGVVTYDEFKKIIDEELNK
jgi:protein-disulfide isomerase